MQNTETNFRKDVIRKRLRYVVRKQNMQRLYDVDETQLIVRRFVGESQKGGKCHARTPAATRRYCKSCRSLWLSGAVSLKVGPNSCHNSTRVMMQVGWENRAWNVVPEKSGPTIHVIGQLIQTANRGASLSRRFQVQRSTPQNWW